MSNNFSNFDCLVAVALTQCIPRDMHKKRRWSDDEVASFDEEEFDPGREDSYTEPHLVDCTSASVSTDGANGAKPHKKRLVSPNDRQEYTISAMFPFVTRKKFVLHWYKFDKLAELTIEPQSLDISYEKSQTIMTRTVKQLYPWSTGEEFEKLQQFYQTKENFFGEKFTWIDLWSIPYAKLWIDVECEKPNLHQSSFLYRRTSFLTHCVKAMWLLDDAAHYLVHVSPDNELFYDRISAGFYVFPASVDEKFFCDSTRIKLMTFGVEQRYPWRTGQTGVVMIKKHIKSRLLTYQELKIVLAQRKQKKNLHIEINISN